LKKTFSLKFYQPIWWQKILKNSADQIIESYEIVSKKIYGLVLHEMMNDEKSYIANYISTFYNKLYKFQRETYVKE